MTKVLCIYDECKWYEPCDDVYGVCQRDEIILDTNVEGILYGCPDAEWEGGADDE